MQAIQVRYLGATNTKGARIKATCEGGSLTESRDYSLDSTEQAERLAYELANEKLNWNVKKLVGGTFNNVDYFVIVK